MPQTQFKGYETQATGTNVGTWGDVLNANMITFADLNLGAITSKTLSNVQVNLTTTEARSAMIRLTGTLTANVVVFNTAQGFYVVENLTTGNFTVNLTNNVVSVFIPQSCRAVIYADATNGVRVFGIASITNPDEVVAGTQMFFFNAAAPTGWTLVTSLNDYALSLSSTTGAVTSGSVNYSTIYGRTATDAYTLTNADVPAHTHNMTVNSAGPNGSPDGAPHWYGRPSVDLGDQTGITDTMTTGGESHTHNVDMRVFTVTTIICSRGN